MQGRIKTYRVSKLLLIKIQCHHTVKKRIVLRYNRKCHGNVNDKSLYLLIYEAKGQREATN
jgi:hypothetical protein